MKWSANHAVSTQQAARAAPGLWAAEGRMYSLRSEWMDCPMPPQIEVRRAIPGCGESLTATDQEEPQCS